MHKKITSLQNKEVKQLVQLQQKSRERRHEKLLVIEGLREIKLALQADYKLHKILFCPEYLNEDISFLKKQTDEFVELAPKVYQKIAYRSSTEGIVAVAQQKTHNLQSLKLSSKHPFVLVAEAPEKPGNIGALLRTADAAQVDAVLIANPKTDIYNPNIIRSSVGCVFTNQIATATSQEIIAFLEQQKINIYSAALEGSTLYTKPDYSKSTALVVGTEAHGLQKEWIKHSKQNIIIPMQGKIDSMNVSVSAGILVFEVKRQRGFE